MKAETEVVGGEEGVVEEQKSDDTENGEEIESSVGKKKRCRQNASGKSQPSSRQTLSGFV